MYRKSLFLLVLAAIVVIVAYRVRGFEFDWSLFFESLWNVHPGWLALSVVATLTSYLIRAFRWQILLHPLKSIGVLPLLNATLVGFSAIYVLGRPGEIVRPLLLTRREQVPFTASLATIVIERFFDTFMLVVLFAWSLLMLDLPAATGQTVAMMKNAAWVMLAALVTGSVMLLVFRANIERIAKRIPFAKISALVQAFGEGLSFLRSGRSLGVAMVHSLVLWIVIAAQFWFMLIGMNFDFTIEAATFVLVGAAIGSTIHVPGIGGGLQAGYIFFMTTFFLVPAEQAIATSLVAWAFSYAPTVVVAGFLMAFSGTSFKDLRAPAV
jgi:uncharacterized protein (TIRG00374 family)